MVYLVGKSLSGGVVGQDLGIKGVFIMENKAILDGKSVTAKILSEVGRNNSILKSWQAYLFAVVATLVAFELRQALASQLGSEPTLVIFTVPIMLSAYVGGLRAGLLSTLCSYCLASYYLVPHYGFWVTSTAQRWNLFFVILAGAVISALNEALYRAHRQTETAILEQQSRVAEVKAGALQNAIFSSANFSCIATDAKGVIQLFNVGAERMLGYTAAEAMNKITPADISDPQEVIARAQALSAELGTPITPGFEALVFKASRGLEDIYDLTYIREDGSRFPAVVSVTALRDGQGGIIGYLLIGTDNTARQRIEEERKAALRELNDVKAAIDQHAIVAITDPKGKITYVNDKFCRISKYPREELLGQDHRIINSEFHSKEFMKNLWQTISEGRVWKGEIKNKAKDGSFYWVDVTIVPYLGENQKPIQYIAIRTDITERKLAEEVSARFAAMVEFSDDAILSKTLDGRITSWNPGAAKLFGYPAAEVIGKTMQSFIPPERPDEEVEILARIAGGENIQHFETMRVRKDRTRIDVSVTISPIKDGQGKVIGVSKIARDNTERKRFEHALQQTNVELEHARRMAEQANRAKSEFISSMSHELRTPLNGIIGFTEFLIDEKPGPLRPKQKEYLGDVLNSGRHLLQLINDVLDLAKVEAGKMELHLETFPVRKAVEEVTAVIQGIANKKQIAIAIEIGPDLDAVMLDQHKFKQILYNLLSNAIKFSDDGGQVSIRARRLDTQQLEIAIRDAGIGIKTEDIGRLFNNFEQLDSGTARRFEGTGLGLALTKKLIEFQGGCIRVESQPAHGSIFTVVLPVEIKKEGTS